MNKKIFAVIKSFKSWLKDLIVMLDFLYLWFLVNIIFILADWILEKVMYVKWGVVIPGNSLAGFLIAVCGNLLTLIISLILYACFDDDRADTRLKMRVFRKRNSLEELNDLDCDLDDRKQELLSRLKTEPADSFFFEDAEVRLAKIQGYIEKTEHEIEVTTNKINKTISRY
jgi:hypothetical protein